MHLDRRHEAFGVVTKKVATVLTGHDLSTTGKSVPCSEVHHRRASVFRKVDIKLPRKGISNSHGARPVY